MKGLIGCLSDLCTCRAVGMLVWCCNSQSLAYGVLLRCRRPVFRTCGCGNGSSLCCCSAGVVPYQMIHMGVADCVYEGSV